mmetsp:Transcript_44977/g.71850  ORF Transcript_44977/g.71850 Transcript_44977/m.71850 type:complete len:221 (+) Transcript_44977:74-736(+)
MTPERARKVLNMLKYRQKDLTVLMDNVYKSHNFGAVLRTCDAVGVDQAHAIIPPDAKGGRMKDIRSSKGASQWTTVTKYRCADTAIRFVREQGMQVVAADLKPDSVDFREVDYTKPTCVVLGCETHGISPRVTELVDQNIIIPIYGLTQSLNVSVAGGIILYEAQRQRMLAGMYCDREIDSLERKHVLVKAFHPKLYELCIRDGTPLPDIDDDGVLVPKN